MTRVTVKFVESGQPDDTAPPAGTAIVRPLRHVRAVRERHLQRFADPGRGRSLAVGSCMGLGAGRNRRRPGD